MTADPEPAVVETLRLLRELSRERVSPPEAVRRMRELQERHPAITFELVWEEERITGCFDYDALLDLPEEGTLSLGVCADRGIPWPLRGATPVRDHDLLRVNREVMT